jgi:hypothetical protein
MGLSRRLPHIAQAQLLYNEIGKHNFGNNCCILSYFTVYFERKSTILFSINVGKYFIYFNKFYVSKAFYFIFASTQCTFTAQMFRGTSHLVTKVPQILRASRPLPYANATQYHSTMCLVRPLSVALVVWFINKTWTENRSGETRVGVLYMLTTIHKCTSET